MTTAPQFAVAADHSHIPGTPVYLCEGGAMTMPGTQNAWKFETRAAAQAVADEYLRVHVVELPA